MKCEGKTYRSDAEKNSEPTWNFDLLLFRSKPDKPITVQVWNSASFIRKTFLGQTVIAAAVGSHSTHVLDLMGTGDKKDEKMAGSVTVEVETALSLTAF